MPDSQATASRRITVRLLAGQSLNRSIVPNAVCSVGIPYCLKHQSTMPRQFPTFSAATVKQRFSSETTSWENMPFATIVLQGPAAPSIPTLLDSYTLSGSNRRIRLHPLRASYVHPAGLRPLKQGLRFLAHAATYLQEYCSMTSTLFQRHYTNQSMHTASARKHGPIRSCPQYASMLECGTPAKMFLCSRFFPAL